MKRTILGELVVGRDGTLQGCIIGPWPEIAIIAPKMPLAMESSNPKAHITTPAMAIPRLAEFQARTPRINPMIATGAPRSGQHQTTKLQIPRTRAAMALPSLWGGGGP